MSHDRNTGRVLVLGDDLRMTLPVVRSLGRQGLEVHVAWAAPASPLRASRFVRCVHELPDCTCDPVQWTAALQSLLREVAFDLVVPTTEAAVHAVQSRRESFESHARIYLLRDDLFDVVFDKSAMHRVAEAASVPVPETCVARSLNDVDRFLKKCRGPVVLKPSHSVTDPATEKQFVQIFDDRSECRVAAGTLLNSARTILLQHFFSGYGVGVEFLARKGRILTAFQHRRIHETSGHGSTYRVGQPVSPELRDATTRMLSTLDYTGVGMCEFRRNAATGDWVFLELNARFWGSLPLACASGADFPWFLFQMMIDGRTGFPQSFRTGLRCRSLRSDLRWMWRAWRGRGRRATATCEQAQGWRLNNVPRWQILCDVARMLAPRDHIDSFAVDDPGPFLSEVTGLLARPFSHRTSERQPVTTTATPFVRQAELIT